TTTRSTPGGCAFRFSKGILRKRCTWSNALRAASSASKNARNGSPFPGGVLLAGALIAGWERVPIQKGSDSKLGTISKESQQIAAKFVMDRPQIVLSATLVLLRRILVGRLPVILAGIRRFRRGLAITRVERTEHDQDAFGGLRATAAFPLHRSEL